MKKRASEVNFETLKLCIGISDLFRRLGRLDLSIKYDLLVKDKLHLDFNDVAKITLEFTLANDVKSIDAQIHTSIKEKDNQVNECIDWYDIVMKKLRD